MKLDKKGRGGQQIKIKKRIPLHLPRIDPVGPQRTITPEEKGPIGFDSSRLCNCEFPEFTLISDYEIRDSYIPASFVLFLSQLSLVPCPIANNG